MQTGMIRFLASKNVSIASSLIGFHIPPFISQKHLHLHGISPTSEMDLSDRISFFMPSFWFKSANEAVEALKHEDL
ncbi:histidine triad nucleotide-binding protein 3 [Drosophila hydei]|uniref:Histidine triad nucleotide-binding protein 3 n=1 Tax=Drosophila hydei TaxID=7224 RepID=A0A6J2SWI5_DROHY|nr:histidine triad nucleotide-binding protein 3 [Drosophila hydei]